MIQEMSLVLFGERFAGFMTKPCAEEMKLAAALVEDAASNARDGREQQNFAEMARTLIVNAENDESRAELTRIAVWHYQKCAVCFCRAVVGYESAAKIQKAEKIVRNLLKNAEDAAEAAMRAELAVLELKDGEKKRAGGLNNETG